MVTRRDIIGGIAGILAARQMPAMPIGARSIAIGTKKGGSLPYDPIRGAEGTFFDIELTDTLDYAIPNVRRISGKPSIKIHWGDGNVETYSTTSTLSYTNIPHTYSAAGRYTIRIENTNVEGVGFGAATATASALAFRRVVYFGSGIKYLSPNFFRNCSNLEDVDMCPIVDGVEVGDYAFYGVRMSARLYPCVWGRVNSNAFYGSTITGAFRSSYGTIVAHAFDSSSLSDIDCPSVTSVLSLSFDNCRKLRHVRLGAISNSNNGIFRNVGADLDLIDGYATTIEIASGIDTIMGYMSKYEAPSKTRFIGTDGYIDYIGGTWTKHYSNPQ